MSVEEQIADFNRKKAKESRRKWYLKHCDEIREKNAQKAKAKPKKATPKKKKSDEYMPKHSKPYMKDSEIVRMYRSALYPSKQIRIIAELNDVSVPKIEAVLERNGIELRKKQGATQ